MERSINYTNMIKKNKQEENLTNMNQQIKKQTINNNYKISFPFLIISSNYHKN